MSDVLGAFVVGSLASGEADAASDVDLIVCVRPGRFDQAWRRRGDLHVTGALMWWDERRDAHPEVAAHRWVTGDLVLVEALFATPGSGMRLASPWRTVSGAASVAENFPTRPPVRREEMDLDAEHPVQRAFDELKLVLRRYAA